MLDRNDQQSTAARLIATLPCRVQLSEKLRERFETTGIAPPTPDDRRRHPRLRCRSEDNRAGLQRQPTFPSLIDDDRWSAIYLADISRGGMQIIHSEPLYPGERLRVLLFSAKVIDLEVVRCRRLGEACFSVGTQVAKDAT